MASVNHLQLPAAVFIVTAFCLLHLFGRHGVSTSSLEAPRHRSCAMAMEDGSGFLNKPSENCSQTLASALNNVSSYTTIQLEPGHHVIQEFILLQDLTNITLETDDIGNLAHVRCSNQNGESAGLAFINVSQLSIRNIVIDGCGFTGKDITSTVTILNGIMNFFYNIPISVQIAMLIGHCEHVEIERVSVMNTRGFGLVGINVIGRSELRNVQFFNNTNPGPCDPSQDIFSPSPDELQQYDSLGGAAVFMYFDYLPESNSMYRGSTFNLELNDCNFTLNSECSLAYLNLLRSPGRGESSLLTSTGYTLGGSGALAIVMAQLDYGVNLTTISSTFSQSSASFGSGSTVAFFTGIRNTHVVFDRCKFDESAIVFFNDVRQPMNNVQPNNVFRRNVVFSVLNSNFTDTTEVTAGSTLLIYSNYYTSVVNYSINVYVDKCRFLRNRATVGSAITIYEYKINGFGEGIQVSIKDTHFMDNEVITGDSENVMVAVSPSASTVNVRNVNLTLHGNCSFVDNIGTGLQAESSVVGINGNVTFLRNIGTNGGAMSLVLYSYLILNRNSSMYFIENQARSGGGAIYVNENGFGSYLIGGYVDCFLHFAYDNFVVCDNCSDINSYGVFLKFSNNVAGYTGSLVSGSSLVTCPWARQLKENDHLNRNVFEILADEYPNVFHINQSQTSSNLVQSMSAQLVVEDYDRNRRIKVFPGQSFEISISALDDFDQIITNIITAFATADSSKYRGRSLIPVLGTTNFAVLESNRSTIVPVKILGEEDQNISLIISSTDSAGRAQKRLNITLLSCGFGFTFNTSNNTCSCDDKINADLDNGITCDSERHEIAVQDGAWIGPFRNVTVVDRCLFQYCQPGTRVINIDSDNMSDIDFNVQCDMRTNRIGFLCSECEKNHSAVLGTRNCRICSNWYIFLFIFLLAIGIVAIIVIQYLNITITGGFIDGAIFYSNIVTLYGYSLVPGDTYNEAIALISFPSLNLGFEICLYNGMSILGKVLWQLSFPVYLFILMFIITLLARTKYLKLNQSVGSGTIRTFATLLILCYVSVLAACSELIAFNRIRFYDETGDQPGRFLQWRGDPSLTYFGKEHAVPGVLACIIVLLYILPLPFLLLFPSVLYSNKYSGKYKPIYDAFWDPYKPRYRFFLGLRLMFRWIPFFLVVTVRPPTSIFVTNFFLILLLLVQCTLQPYKEKWQNYVDSAFLCNLILLLSGSVFFWSEFNSARSNADILRKLITRHSLIYSNVLIVFGFFTIISIIFYHICIRFPQLQQHLKKIVSKLSRLIKSDDDQADGESEGTTVIEPQLEAEPHTPDLDDDEQAGNRVTRNQRQTLLPPLRASELREPLLESGTVSLYAVDTTLVPSRVQTFLGDLRRQK